MNGDEIAIVPHLVLLEILDAMHKRLTERFSDAEKFDEIDEQKAAEIKKKVMTNIYSSIDLITSLSMEGKVLMINPQMPLDDYLAITLELYKPYLGYMEETNSCPQCHQKIAPKYRYRGTGFYDFQHAINAKECGAVELHTHDTFFKDFVKLPRFSKLRIIIS
jgi:hypothetical protein